MIVQNTAILYAQTQNQLGLVTATIELLPSSSGN